MVNLIEQSTSAGIPDCSMPFLFMQLKYTHKYCDIELRQFVSEHCADLVDPKYIKISVVSPTYTSEGYELEITFEILHVKEQT